MSARPRIRLRLTAWYAGSILLLLLVAVLSMRQWARQALADQAEESSDRAVQLVRSFFRAELSEYRTIEPTLVHLAGELVFADMGMEFLRPDGTTFVRARAPTGPLALPPPIRDIVVPLDPALAPAWHLRLQLSIADRVAAERRIDGATLVAIPLAVALAALAGWLVTGRALTPVAAMAAAAERLATGTPAGRLPVADPHDEFGRLGRRFNDLLDRLDTTLAQQRRFLADAAHELRTPIARMLGEAEVQLSEGSPAEGDHAALVRIHQDLGRASGLVDELMQLARADAGSATAIRAPAYLDDVVADALGAWEQEARRRAIAFEVALREEAPATLDARLVARLLGVLVDNALRHTPASGTVAVRVVRHGTRAVLEVEDSGTGIPRDERVRVFERFYRGADARQLAPEGSGLGLAIARWIAEQHEATITLDEGTHGGARFRVSFPPRDAAPVT